MPAGTAPSLTKTYSGSRGHVLMAQGSPLTNTLETYHSTARRKMAWGTGADFDSTKFLVQPMTISGLPTSVSQAPLVCEDMTFTAGTEFRKAVGDNYLPAFRVRETSIGSYKAQIQAPLLITPDADIQAGYKLLNHFVCNGLGVQQTATEDSYASRIGLKTSIYDYWLLYVLNDFSINASGVGGLQPINFSLNMEGILPSTYPFATQVPNRYAVTSTTNYVYDGQIDVTGTALESGGRLANIKDCIVRQSIYGLIDQVVDISLQIKQTVKLKSTSKPEDAGWIPRHADHMYVGSRAVTGSITHLGAIGINSGSNEGAGLLNLTIGPFLFIMPNAFWTNTVTKLSTGVPVSVINFIAKGITVGDEFLCREFL